ncbi:MAG UNVERIFIED_CONTAM: hypothetical protein LVT10_27370 [Anaerolineae bacterium]|jgi:DNA helicase-2/ATP-dependent DNA helicase PcrA
MKINNHFEDRFLMSLPNLEDLWVESNFKPNEDQQEAIRHINSPLYLTAGPVQVKLGILLWRTLNLIVYHNIKPEEIFLQRLY